MIRKLTLVADSGSTKTSWQLLPFFDGRAPIRTSGINPVLMTEDEISALLRTEWLDELNRRDIAPERIAAIHFYGAGCTPARSKVVGTALTAVFPSAEVHVASDLLGAARALCGYHEGIACILGTGSNSGLYDGREVVQNVSPLGYVLGDEGSGAVLGRRLVGDMLKGLLPEEMKRAFLEEYNLTPETVIERVYRQPLANRFLASLTPYLSRHRNHPHFHHLLVDSFRDFFRRNVKLYHRPDLPVHFVGSIAHYFFDELAEAARTEQLTLGTVWQEPLEGLLAYHRVE